MTAGTRQQVGAGPLRIGGVLRLALGMFRLGYRRVAGVALLLFAVPAVSAAVAEEAIGRANGGQSIAAIPVTVIALVVAGVLRLLGPVVYSGYLDEAVGREYVFGHHQRFGSVVRNLPIVRLLAADVIVVAGVSIGLSLLIVPGLIFFILFGLVGPVLVQERLGLLPAFARTMRLSRTAPLFVLLLVIVPVAGEQALHEAMHHALEAAGLGMRVLVEWVVAVTIGASVSLVEVALAAELIARNPAAHGSPNR